eukprot:6205577-Pleurochrysis_carterae.AAC.1
MMVHEFIDIQNSSAAHDGGASGRADGSHVLGGRAAGGSCVAASYKRVTKGGRGGRRGQIFAAAAGGGLACGPASGTSDSQNLRYSAKAMYSPLRRWGEWRRDGPTDTSLSIHTLISYLTDGGETLLIA